MDNLYEFVTDRRLTFPNESGIMRWNVRKGSEGKRAYLTDGRQGISGERFCFG